MTPKAITMDMTLRDGEQRAAFKEALDQMGVTLTSSSSFETAFTRMKEAADRYGQVPGHRIRAIVDEVESGMEILKGVSDSFR
ncbi:MAG TPA: hypothetical protein VMQ46_02155 [Acidimicrobiia bacterium]|nr:hypothetical protein [Acidimicrobiia bacterium]